MATSPRGSAAQLASVVTVARFPRCGQHRAVYGSAETPPSISTLRQLLQSCPRIFSNPPAGTRLTCIKGGAQAAEAGRGRASTACRRGAAGLPNHGNGEKAG